MPNLDARRGLPPEALLPFPKLAKLRLHTCVVRPTPSKNLPLRALRWDADGMMPEDLEELTTAPWPRLETLELRGLYFTEFECEEDHRSEMRSLKRGFRRLLAGKTLPALRHFTLDAVGLADVVGPLETQIRTSPLGQRLHSLNVMEKRDA